MRARRARANPLFGVRPAEWLFANVTRELAGELRTVSRYCHRQRSHDLAGLFISDLDSRRTQYFHCLVIEVGVVRDGLIRAVGLDLEGRGAALAVIRTVVDFVNVGLAGKLKRIEPRFPGSVKWTFRDGDRRHKQHEDNDGVVHWISLFVLLHRMSNRRLSARAVRTGDYTDLSAGP